MQRKISINEELYNKIKTFASREYRSITKEIEYIIKFYEQYYMTEYPATFTSPGSPSPFTPYPHYNDPTHPDYINPADPMHITCSPEYTTDEEHTVSQANTILNSRIIEYERHMGDPDNEYYQKIKKFFTHTDPDLLAFNELLSLADDNNFVAISNSYDYSIKKALDIPLTHDISRSEWKEIVRVSKID